MNLELLVPELRDTTLEEVLALLNAAPQRLPFSDELIGFCGGLSEAIFRDRQAARFPELAALAFWMRKAALIRLSSDFRKTEAQDTCALPRGLVFHIPPGNVDTIFIYSWLLSALTGNRNVIRLSLRRTEQTEILLRIWREALSSAPALWSNTLILRYGHDEEITRALSMHCDMRVIWGGDETVSRIRAIPLPPLSREIAFPDRYSLAVLKADRYLDLGNEERAGLAGHFFNDAYWFDQMACSSPRMVVWAGETEAVKSASELFWSAMTVCIERKEYESSPAVQMRKFVFACAAIVELPVSKYRRDRETTVIELDSLSIPREHCGGGLFFSCRVDTLADLAPALKRKDQTLVQFGFSQDELRDFVLSGGGKAIDRIVPIGQALQFSRFWDGYDLLHEFCRLTFVSSAGRV